VDQVGFIYKHFSFLIYFNNLSSTCFEYSNCSSSAGSYCHMQHMVFTMHLRWLAANTIKVEMQQRVDVWDFDFLWSSTLTLLYQHCLTGCNKSKYDLQDQWVRFRHAPITVQITLSSMQYHLSLSDVFGWHTVRNKILVW